jgi:hypothetical protein
MDVVHDTASGSYRLGERLLVQFPLLKQGP